MSRYIATYGARQTIVYAASLAMAREKATAWFRVPDDRAGRLVVELEPRS